MQQDLLANGNYASYLAHALTPPMHGAAGLMSGYGANQGISPQFGNPQPGNPGFGQFGQGQFGQGQFGQDQFGQGNGISQPNFGHQGLQSGFGQPGFGQHIAAQQQQQIAAMLHQLAHQAAAQVVLGQQIAAVLNQLAQQCAWQAQANGQNRHGGVGAYGQPFGQAGGFNRPLW
jgi:hypothetical protein